MRVEELTPVAQDYLKVIWSAVEWGEPPISTKALAARFATSQANVSETMRRLEGQGLIDYQPYKPVTLTPLGERLAVAMVRRHRLLETFLAEVLHYGWEEVHEDAELLEHAASERFLQRIDEVLGHPLTDPHGDPIPPDDGTWTSQQNTPRLADVGPGEYRVVRVSDADPERLTRLRSEGILPGAHLRVGSGAASVTRPDGTPVRLLLDDVTDIWVRRWARAQQS